MNLNLYNELLKKQYDILFCWIPGHNGIKGNENADKAAKHASSILNAAIPYSELKYAVGKFIKNKWQENWNMQIKWKLKHIKPIIILWLSIAHRKTDVLFSYVLGIFPMCFPITHLHIDHSRITHRQGLISHRANGARAWAPT